MTVNMTEFLSLDENAMKCLMNIVKSRCDTTPFRMSGISAVYGASLSLTLMTLREPISIQVMTESPMIYLTHHLRLLRML